MHTPSATRSPVAVTGIETPVADGSGPATCSRLRRAVEHAVHLLPSQGPLKVFVHHNTLHAFEEMPFGEAVVAGGVLYGCEPYLSESAYRRLRARGRIGDEDLHAALLEDLGDRADDLVGFLGTRHEIRLAMLRHELLSGSAAELHWLIAETDAFRRFRHDVAAEVKRRLLFEFRRQAMRGLRVPTSTNPAGLSSPWVAHAEQLPRTPVETWSDLDWEAAYLDRLWNVCLHGTTRAMRQPTPPRFRRLRDALLQATGVDADDLVNDILVRFCAAYLDQGYSHWPLPEREAGFVQAFASLYGRGHHLTQPWLNDLPRALRGLRGTEESLLQSIADSLMAMGIDQSAWEDAVQAALLALRGWAGLIWQMETNAEWTPHPAPKGSLLGYLAIRMILERLALSHVARQQLGYRGDLRDLGDRLRETEACGVDQGVEHRAFLLYQLAQLLGWEPEALGKLLPVEWMRLTMEIANFGELARRRIFHAAYERRYRVAALDALAVRTRQAPDHIQPAAFQVITCIDEREESFRRHLEEVAPECETFGVAGFFGVAMYYRGAADAHYVPLCPVVIKPRHFVTEQVAFTHEAMRRRREVARRTLGAASHRWNAGSRTFWGGIVTSLAGSLAAAPLVARVLFPRGTSRLRRLLGRFLRPPPATRLELERLEPEPADAPGHIGYTLEEMAGIVERVLKDIGLTSHFSKLVIVCGHGSNSLNNPHEAAHDCGACGGARGGPNARAFAQMANSKRVREYLARRGLTIPPAVHFVGAYHNTCDDSMQYFDLERLPTSLADEFLAARDALDQARQRNAHERCRRFESAPLVLSFEAALRHVEARAEDLSQTRPEYGHATNALCIVGRRALTRGLYCDRRAFLASYDARQDDAEGSILARILAAVIPVCAGISLEYYFSFVDPTGYGCGTKLPHNITSLLGVMDGAASDMRPGLPWQMVEIHEPMRLLFVIETTPATMLRIIDRNAEISRLCRNAWVQLATIDPQDGNLHLFERDKFVRYLPSTSELPTSPSSVDWYRGWRDHLGFALIGPGSGLARNQNAAGGA